MALQKPVPSLGQFIFRVAEKQEQQAQNKLLGPSHGTLNVRALGLCPDHTKCSTCIYIVGKSRGSFGTSRHFSTHKSRSRFTIAAKAATELG